MNPAPASSRGAAMARLLAIAVVFCAVHLLTLSGDVRLAVLVLLGAMLAGPGATSLRRMWRNRWATIAITTLLLAAVGGILFWPGAGVQAALILPTFVGYMVTSAFFAYSLLPGEDPAITRMCRFLRGNVLPDGLEEYARLLTWGWAILPACLAVGALLVFAVAGLEAWSWMTNIFSPLVLALYFVGEHLVRRICYPHLGKPSLMQTFDLMFNSMAWRR